VEEMGARQLDHALCLPNGLEMSRPASASILARTRFAAAGRVGSIELLGSFADCRRPDQCRLASRADGRAGPSQRARYLEISCWVTNRTIGSSSAVMKLRKVPGPHGHVEILLISVRNWRRASME